MSKPVHKIAIVSVGRSDIGIWKPVVRALAPHFECGLALSGTHLLEGDASTRASIEPLGLPVWVEANGTPAEDSPLEMARATGRATMEFAEGFSESRPDLVFVLGDRFETYAAAQATALLNIPLAHLHGGELSLGAIDDSLRHSITKLSHLHFVSTDAYAGRVAQLGEEPWRIIVSGAPALDDILTLDHIPLPELEKRIGFTLSTPPFLITLHPESLNPEQTPAQMKEVIEALATFDRPMVFTAPNADAGGEVIREVLESFVSGLPHAVVVENLGSQAYYSMMNTAAVMIGNSSSGIIEAASYQLPVVNIGERQAGRLRTTNIIDCSYASGEITAAIRTALSSEFTESISTLRSPYGEGKAGPIICQSLQKLNVLPPLIPKKFIDL
jgi:UDP-hydrolysing UDP-N-acetyl-D-glucosamine 2-epimerase